MCKETSGSYSGLSTGMHDLDNDRKASGSDHGIFRLCVPLLCDAGGNQTMAETMDPCGDDACV